jgi:hypothetical protein
MLLKSMRLALLADFVPWFPKLFWEFLINCGLLGTGTWLQNTLKVDKLQKRQMFIHLG